MLTIRFALRPLVVPLVALLSGSFANRDACADMPVPDVGRSTVSQNLNIEPGGNIPFSVTVRDQHGSLIANAFVMVDLCACPAVVLCPGSQGPQNWVTNGCEVRGPTGANGTHVFFLKGGGGCSTVNVKVYVDGVYFVTRRVTSPDQNADLVVDAADVAALNAKMGGSDLSGDINGDGSVTIADQVVLGMYLGQTCLVPTPTQRSTWGELKIRYR